MSETDWALFFDLLERIIHLNCPTWEDKRDIVEIQARQHDACTQLGEFVGWQWSEDLQDDTDA